MHQVAVALAAFAVFLDYDVLDVPIFLLLPSPYEGGQADG